MMMMMMMREKGRRCTKGVFTSLPLSSPEGPVRDISCSKRHLKFSICFPQRALLIPLTNILVNINPEMFTGYLPVYHEMVLKFPHKPKIQLNSSTRARLSRPEAWRGSWH